MRVFDNERLLTLEIQRRAIRLSSLNGWGPLSVSNLCRRVVISLLVDNAFSKHKTSVKCVEDKLEDLAGFVRKVRRQTLNNGGVGLPELKNLEEKVHSIKKSVQFLKDTDIFRVAITTKLTSDEILKEAKDHNVLIVSLLKIGFVNRKVQFVADGSFQNLKDFLARMKDVERAEELNHIDASR